MIPELLILCKLVSLSISLWSTGVVITKFMRGHGISRFNFAIPSIAWTLFIHLMGWL